MTSADLPPWRRRRPLGPALLAALAVLATGAGAARAELDAGPPGTGAPPAPVGISDGGSPTDEAAPQSPSTPAEAAPGLFEQSAPAAGAGADPAVGTAPSSFNLDGYTRGDIFVGKVPGAARGQIKADYGELSLQVRTPKSPYGDGFADARIRYGLDGQDQGALIDLREAYVNAYLGPFDLRLGQQIIVWGRADALNPTSNLTPVDFRIRSPLEDDIRIGNVGARTFLRFAPFRLEAVWMPLYLPTVLPPVVLPQYVSYGAPVFPSPDLANGLEAGRLHLERPGFEMSVSYLYGYAPLPGLTLTGLTLTADAMGTPNPTMPPSILVSRTAYNHQVIGFDFSTALGDLLTLRGEAAYRRPFDFRERIYAPDPDLQYVLGADHNFGAVSLIGQYMGRYVFDWRKQSGSAMALDPAILPIQNMANDSGFVTNIVNAQLAKTNQILFSQTARLQHLVTLRFEWLAAHETLSISALALFNFTTDEWLFTPRIGYRLSDALTAYVGAQIFKGPNDTLFGLIDEELSAGYAELRYTF